MAEERFTREELTARVEALRSALRGMGLDGAVLLQRADLIYYTGSVYQGALVLPAESGGRLLVWRGMGRIGQECPFTPEAVKGFGRLPEALGGTEYAGWKRIGFEEDTVPVGWWRLLGPGLRPGAEFLDISPAIRTQRSVKSPAELARVRASGKVLAAGFEALRELIREGVPEYEVQAQMDVVMRRAGDQSAGRTRGFNAEAQGAVASGPSAAVDITFDGPIPQPGRNPLAPVGAGSAPLRAGEPIICDYTAGVDGYMTDMTRTYCIGELDRRFVDAHNFCVHLIEECERRLVPGAIPAEIYLWAVSEAGAAGYGEVFMNRGANRVRFLGHGIGLEMDEWPVLAKPFRDPLVEGTVLAVEPKIIFEDGGVGVEDTLIVRPGGAESVTVMERGLIRAG